MMSGNKKIDRVCESCKWYLAKTKSCVNNDSDCAGAVKKDDTCIYHAAKCKRVVSGKEPAEGVIECSD